MSMSISKFFRNLLRWIFVGGPWALLLPMQASALQVTVAGTSNLYFYDWGHDFALSDTEVTTLANANGWDPAGVALEYQATGDGTPPVSTPFSFSPGTQLQITAGGNVVDNGDTATGPAGDPGESWDFRALPVYALIGIWSSDPSLDSSDDPVGDPFLIGSGGLFEVPWAGNPLYLVLAENDGIFWDNSGDYAVTLTAVPLPSTLLLLGGTLPLLWLRGKKGK